MIRPCSSDFLGYMAFLISLLHLSLSIHGQEGGKMVPHTPDYRFRDGIFLNFEMVKSNSPVQKKSLLIADDYNDADFFRRILTAGEIRFKDEAGNIDVIRREEVFAFSVDGKLSIMYRGRFSRDVLVGPISLFTFSKQRYYGSYTGTEIEEGLEGGKDRSAIKGDKDYERLRYHGSNTCLLDFASGRVLRLNRRNLGLLLSRDKTISDEYKSLSRRWSRVQMFYFLGKFNEKNPLYLPEY